MGVLCVMGWNWELGICKVTLLSVFWRRVEMGQWKIGRIFFLEGLEPGECLITWLEHSECSIK